jgi:hypothetical protein
MSDVPAVIDNDGFAAVADTASRLIGQSLKFRKGEFVVGRDEDKLNGAVLVAHRVVRCWQKWADARVVDTLYAEPGKLLPGSAEEIEDLSDEPGEWQLTTFLYLRDLDDGRDYAFITSSFGGRRAVESLASQINNMRWQRPGCLPLVRLDKGSFKTRQYGDVPSPRFTVTGWVTSTGEPWPDHVVEPASNVATLPIPQVQRPEPGYGRARTPVNDLDDDIPF